MLTITVNLLNTTVLAPPITASFDETGGTIGRAAESTLVLTDPERKISRTHAVVFHRDGAFGLRDQGSVVPVLLNGQPIGNGREVPLCNGDELRISGYSMRITADPKPEALQNTIGGDASDAMAAPVLSWGNDSPAMTNVAITTVVLEAPEGEASAPPPIAKTPAEIAAALEPPPASEPEPPAPIAPSPAPEPVAAAAAAGVEAPSASSAELLHALLGGAGLRDLQIAGGLTPELMNQLGQLMHEATHGLIDLLAARANAKRQVRADMTVIVTHDNNPLKFSPNVETAIAQLLVPKGKGFMPPLRAVGDAYEDLRTHQQGFMEGMRSALAMVLSRFNPKELERRMSEHSMVSSLLPTTRKAKLWDQFGNMYVDITKEAESDFHTLFGQEFLKAYQAHVGKTPGRGDAAPKS